MAAPFNTERARWQAVMARDPAASNAFVYTVSSTRIYCRPTCPARLARRANIGFCDHADQAAALGYRPCKRCKPEVGCGQPEDAAVTAVRGFVAGGDDVRRYTTLKQMADHVSLSKWHFHRTFVKVTGITPGAWIKQQKQPNINETANSNALPGDMFVPFYHSGSSTGQSTSPLTPSASCDSCDALDPMLDLQISEEEWQKLVDFNGSSEAADWEAFDVSFADLC